MSGTAADVLAWAESQVGTPESPPGSNHVKYWDEIGRHDFQGQSWCAAFVTDALRQNSVPFPTVDTAGGYVYCPDEVSYAKAHGNVVSAGNVLPGDIVLYDWNGDKLADHTGLFLKWIVGGQTFEAVEGNTSMPNGEDGVAIKNRTVSEVVCFVRPPYLPGGAAGVPVGATPVATPGVSLAAIGGLVAAAKKQTLKKGSTGLAVGILQGRLRDLGFDTPGMVDANMNTASFGLRTFSVVQTFQRSRHLVVDGVVGPQTWAALFPG